MYKRCISGLSLLTEGLTLRKNAVILQVKAKVSRQIDIFLLVGELASLL